MRNYRYGPITSDRKIRLWYYHFLKFDDLPYETKTFFKRQHRLKKRCGDLGHLAQQRACEMDNCTSAVITQIVEDNPHLYLDEIKERIFIVTGKKWSCSFIWYRLRDLGYTIQVATEREPRNKTNKIKILIDNI